MKIAHIGKYYWPERGGIETHMRDLCEGLVKCGVSVKAIVSNNKNIAMREIINGVEVVRLPKSLSVLGQPISNGITNEIKKFDPDLIHIQLPNPLPMLKILNSLKPIIVTYQSDLVGKPAIPTHVFDSLTEVFLKRADVIIATSENYANGSKILSKFREKIKVVPLSIELKKLKPVSAKKIGEFRRELGLKKEIILLFVGRLVPYKGLQFLLRALPMLKGNFKLIVVGSGPLEMEMRKLSDDLNISNRVFFFGEANDEAMPNLYSLCNIFILSSNMRSEAFGIVQMEAMAYGKPVISCNIPGSGVPWVNKNMESGLIVEPENPDELAGAIQKLIDSPKLRKKLGDGGQARVKKLFDSKKMVKDILKIYEEILSK